MEPETDDVVSRFALYNSHVALRRSHLVLILPQRFWAGSLSAYYVDVLVVVVWVTPSTLAYRASLLATVSTTPTRSGPGRQKDVFFCVFSCSLCSWDGQGSAWAVRALRVAVEEEGGERPGLAFTALLR